MTKDAASQAYVHQPQGMAGGFRDLKCGEAGAQRLSITTARRPVSFWLERNEMKRRAPGVEVVLLSVLRQSPSDGR